MSEVLIPVIQRVVAILWPAFITASIATVLFFIAFDAQIFFVEYDISQTGVYSIAFFIFWFFGIFTSAATCYFLKPCSVINAQKNSKLGSSESST